MTTLANVKQGFELKGIEIEEHVLCYEIYKGAVEPKRTFVLSHGAFARRNFMKVIAAEIVKQYADSNVILLDLPWHGNSISTVEPLRVATIETYTDVVEQYIGALKEKREIAGKLHWLGWSMGGSIGQLLELRGVGIDELTLLNSSPIWESIKGLVEHVPDATDETKIKDFYRFVLTDSLQINMTEAERLVVLMNYDELTSAPEVMVQDMLAIVPSNFDVRDKLPNIQAKTLVVGGAADEVAEVKYQHLLAEKIPNAKLKMTSDNHLQLVKSELVKDIVGEMVKYFD